MIFRPKKRPRLNGIQDLKVINQEACEKAYHIYLMHDQWLTFLWYSLLLLSPSSCLIHPLLFKFEQTWVIQTMYQYWDSFSSTGIIFIHGLFCFRWISFHRQYYFQDISRFRQIQGHFQNLENEFVTFQVFLQYV